MAGLRGLHVASGDILRVVAASVQLLSVLVKMPCHFLQSRPCMLGPICICVFIPDQFALAPDSVTRKKPGSGLLGPNQILTDFNVFDIYNEEEVTAKIQEVDATFHLVMILERFQESLILMRNILGWSFDDIKNLKLNARKETKVVITIRPRGVCAKCSTDIQGKRVN